MHGYLRLLVEALPRCSSWVRALASLPLINVVINIYFFSKALPVFDFVSHFPTHIGEYPAAVSDLIHKQASPKNRKWRPYSQVLQYVKVLLE